MCEKMTLYFVSVLFAAVFVSKGLQIPDEKEKPVKDLKTSKAEEDMLKLKSHHMECTEETRVDPNLVVKLKGGDWKNEGLALKKWVLCVLNRFGLMSKEGIYKLDEAFSKFPKKDESKVDKIVDECLTTKSLPPADIAWEYVKCLNVKDPHGNFSSISVKYTINALVFLKFACKKAGQKLDSYIVNLIRNFDSFILQAERALDWSLDKSK